MAKEKRTLDELANMPDELQAIVNKVTSPKPDGDFEDGAEVAGQNGKVWYKYHVEGEVQLLPKKIEDMTEEDWYATPITLMNVQTNRIPQELTVKGRDPQWAFRWFNKSAKDGTRINQARYMGFIPATKDDIDWAFNMKNINDRDGAVEQGDLVLFKIHKAKLAAMLQKNFHEARSRGTKEAYRGEAEGNLLVPDNHRTHVGFSLTEHAERDFQGLGPVVPL